MTVSILKRHDPFMRLVRWLLAVAACVAGFGPAAAGVDYARQGHWQGALGLPVDGSDDGYGDTVRLIVNGDVVYASGTAYTWLSGKQYAIDFSDPVHPVVTDSLSLYFADVAMSGDYLYVASGYQGLNIVSLADPRHPRLVSHLDLDVRAHYVRVHNGLAYVGSDVDESALVVDVSDPEQPLLLGPFEQGWGIRILEFRGNVAYMTGKDDKLRIVDLSDPLRAVPIGEIGRPEFVHDMKVVGDLGVLVTNDAVYLLGLEDAARPERLASIKWPAHGWEQKIHVADGMLFVSHFHGSVGWDITQPDQPVEIGEIPVLDGYRGLAVGDDRVYMASCQSAAPVTISSLDLATRDLVRPAEMTRIPSVGWKFDLAGDLLVTTEGSVLRVIDVGDPNAAVERGSLDSGGSHWTLADVDGTLAAALSYVEIRIVDISDPAAPRARGRIPVDDVREDGVALRGNLAFVVTYAWPGPNELAIHDLSDPDQPVRIGTLALPHANEEVLVSGNLVICRVPGAITICDVSDPADPRLVSVTLCSAVGMGLSGNDLYLGRWQGGFEVYDISDPSQPQRRGLFRTLGLTTRFAFDGDILYAGDYLHGCQVIDMSDVTHPAWVGSLLNPVVEYMQVRGDWVHFGSHAAPRHVAAAPSGAPAPRDPRAPLAATVHPNPFNPVAVVGFELDARGPVLVTVHDIAGRRLATVVDAVLEPGHHAVRWDGAADGGKAAAGTYFFTVSAGGVRQSVKAVLLK
jgi:hypothetical protein